MAKRATKVFPHSEPILSPMHRYIVVIYASKRGRWYRYCANRQEVRELKKKQKPGTYLEVFKATHDFKEAWLAN